MWTSLSLSLVGHTNLTLNPNVFYSNVSIYASLFSHAIVFFFFKNPKHILKQCKYALHFQHCLQQTLMCKLFYSHCFVRLKNFCKSFVLNQWFHNCVTKVSKVQWFAPLVNLSCYLSSFIKCNLKDIFLAVSMPSILFIFLFCIVNFIFINQSFTISYIDLTSFLQTFSLLFSLLNSLITIRSFLRLLTIFFVLIEVPLLFFIFLPFLYVIVFQCCFLLLFFFLFCNKKSYKIH